MAISPVSASANVVSSSTVDTTATVFTRSNMFIRIEEEKACDDEIHGATCLCAQTWLDTETRFSRLTCYRYPNQVEKNVLKVMFSISKVKRHS